MRKIINTILCLLLFCSLVSAQTLTVYTANLAHGQKTNNSFDFSLQVSDLADGDLIATQEIGTTETGWNASLASNNFTQVVYLENSSLADGNAIWMKNTCTVNQTYSHLLSDGFTGGGFDVDKSAVAAKVTCSGVQFYFVSTHLCWSACTSDQRMSQANELISWISSTLTGGLDIIIAGDMNFPPDATKNPSGLQKDVFTTNGFQDLWNTGITNATATANWGDRDGLNGTDMPVSDLGSLTHDDRRIDYIFASNTLTSLVFTGISIPDTRATCSVALTSNGDTKECPDVLQLWDNVLDLGVRSSDHNYVRATFTFNSTVRKCNHHTNPKCNF